MRDVVHARELDAHKDGARNGRLGFHDAAFAESFLYLARATTFRGGKGGEAACAPATAQDKDLLVPSNIDPWPEVPDKLNMSPRGWSN